MIEVSITRAVPIALGITGVDYEIIERPEPGESVAGRFSITRVLSGYAIVGHTGAMILPGSEWASDREAAEKAVYLAERRRRKAEIDATIAAQECWPATMRREECTDDHDRIGTCPVVHPSEQYGGTAR